MTEGPLPSGSWVYMIGDDGAATVRGSAANVVHTISEAKKSGEAFVGLDGLWAEEGKPPRTLWFAPEHVAAVIPMSAARVRRHMEQDDPDEDPDLD